MSKGIRPIKKPKGQSHIVQHQAFSDAAPTLGGASTTYKAGGSGPLPSGAPRYVQPKGVLRTRNATSSNGLTNKRY